MQISSKPWHIFQKSIIPLQEDLRLFRKSYCQTQKALETKKKEIQQEKAVNHYKRNYLMKNNFPSNVKKNNNPATKFSEEEKIFKRSIYFCQLYSKSLPQLIESKKWEDVKKYVQGLGSTEKVPDLEQLQAVQLLLKIGSYQEFSSTHLAIIQESANILSQNIKLISSELNVFVTSLEMIAAVNQVANFKIFKTLISLFKLQTLQMNDIKNIEKLFTQTQLIENNFRIVFRYAFIGLEKFEHQLFNNLNCFLKYDQSTSGSSEFSSDQDELNMKDYPDYSKRIFMKLRGSAVLLLQYLIRSFPKAATNIWQIFVKSTALQQSQILKINMEGQFNEPSLVSLLIHENQKKIKINAISALIILFDVLQIGKWIISHDFDRVSYSKQQSSNAFQPKAFQFYQAAKNMHFVVLNLLIQQFSNPDFQFICMLLKLEQVVINSTLILEKLPEEMGSKLYCDQIVIPLIFSKLCDEQKQSNCEIINSMLNVKINALQTFNLILQSDIYFEKLGNDYFGQNNIFRKIMETISENQKTVRQKQCLEQSQENLLYIYSQECYGVLQKMQKHYQNYCVNDAFLQSFEKLYQPEESKFQVLWYKLLEEICHFLPGRQFYNEDFEEQKQMPSIKSEEYTKFEDQIYNRVIPKILVNMITSNQSDILVTVLNILGDLSQSFWNQNNMHLIIIQKLNELYEKIFKQDYKLKQQLNTSSLKIAFYKCLGSLSYIDVFIKNSEIVACLINFLNNAMDKNNQNIHVVEKISWTVANICSNVEYFQISQSLMIYDLLICFASHSKEKVSTNGLRGLGHFLRKIPVDNFNLMKQDDLIGCFVGCLSSKNPKIQWNCSFSLNNLLLGELDEMKLIIGGNEEILQSIISIMQGRMNMKSQIHCIEMILNLEEQVFKKQENLQYDWQMKLIIELLKLLNDFVEASNFIEQKYQARLREQAIRLLQKLLVKHINNVVTIESLQAVLHDNGILKRLLEEMHELIQFYGKQNSFWDIWYLKGDFSVQEAQERIEKICATEEIASGVNTESEIQIQKYLRVKVSEQELFCGVLDCCQSICRSVLRVIDESDAIEENVNFLIYEAFGELVAAKIMDQTIVIKI